MLPACPVLYYTDTNTNHSINWSESAVGRAWLANGEAMWQERLILLGYENRQRYYPAGSPPFLMFTNKKSKNNHGSGNQSNPNQGNQGNQGNNRGNQNQGNQGDQGNQNNQGNQGNQGNFNRDNQNQGSGNQSAGRGYQGKNPRGGKYNPLQGGPNLSSDSAGQNQGTNTYDVDTSDMLNLPDFASFISHVDTPPMLIQDEYLHDASTLPSNHLNVTVSVQDKDPDNQTSVRCIVGKAVLDTVNYSEDFISFIMIQKLNAMHLCYEAPKAITVCSGLDGHCYINNKIINLTLQFHSYDGECHTIPLTLRVNRNTDIELLLSRNTVNKYDFMSLTPFAFGISPELSAENKRKKDTCWREFEEREAIVKLDPLHWHKYTRRMISEGFQPEEPELESITPFYDMLKGITKTKLALKREPYGLCQTPKPKKAILHAPLTKEVVGSDCYATSTCSLPRLVPRESRPKVHVVMWVVSDWLVSRLDSQNVRVISRT